MKKLLGLMVAAGIALGGNLANASATTGLGGQIFATGGQVSVDVLASDSGFNDQIELFYAYPDLSQKTFIGIDNNPVTVNLGNFAAGQELVFGIISPQGTFVLGGGSRNPDGLEHGWVDSTATVAGFAESWLVGFEDLIRGGDKDYNDAIFRVNLKSAPVPEPGSLALLAAGLFGLVVTRRKQA